MKRNSLIVLSLCISLLTAAMPVLAHHAISAEFDTTKPIKFEGTVKSVDWMNPHIYVNIESKESGKTVVYSVEGGPPNALFRQGWRPDRRLLPRLTIGVRATAGRRCGQNQKQPSRMGPAGVSQSVSRAAHRKAPWKRDDGV